MIDRYKSDKNFHLRVMPESENKAIFNIIHLSMKAPEHLNRDIYHRRPMHILHNIFNLTSEIFRPMEPSLPSLGEPILTVWLTLLTLSIGLSDRPVLDHLDFIPEAIYLFISHT